MRKKVFFIALIIMIVTTAVVAQAQVANNNYCVNPIFSNEYEKPNIMIIVDHSGSMQFPAYVPCVWGGYNSSTALCGTSTSGVSGAPFYNSTTTYYAYFDPTKNYSYNASGYFQAATCTPSTAGGCFPGNLLNFVTATRIDVSRKILTGGRTRTIGSQLTFDNEGSNYTFTETALHCQFSLSDQSTGDPTTRRISIANSGGTCAIGTLGVSNINIAISATPTGVIDNFKDKVTFESMIFNTSSGNQGLIKTGKQLNNTTDIDALKLALNTQTPYNGTPTGEALWEAYDFFKQSNDHSYVSNSGFMDKGNTSNDRDPWYDGTGANKKLVPCRKSFVLLLSDGAWNGDIDPVRPIREMHVNDLRSDLTGTQNVTTYVIYAFGDLDPSTKAQGRNAMITAAIFGGHDFVNTGDWPFPFVSFNPSGNCPTVLTPAEDVTPRTSIRDVGGTTYCNSRYTPNGITSPSPFLTQCTPCATAPCATWDAQCGDWDRHESGPTGLPYNFFEANNPADLESRLTDSLNDMLRRASSGSGVAMVGSSEGGGGNLLQGLFYPKKTFDDTDVRWVGELKDLWYFIDPYILRSSVREDTNQDNVLSLGTDLVLRYYWNETEQKTYVRKFRDDTPATQDPRLPPIFTLVSETDHDGILALWEAGVELHHKSAADRRIFVNADSNPTPKDFTAGNAGILQPFINPLSATDTLDTVNYVRGIDSVTYRNRTVMAARRGETPAITGTWKLGDVVSSTARVMSGEPLNDYNQPTPSGYGDQTYTAYTQLTKYKNRGMVFVGANDGMLHAFELGGLRQIRQPDIKAELNPNSRGNEKWAFIPQSVLPYLTYLKDPNYKHVFTVDGNLMLADVSFMNPGGAKDVNSWRTVLIGSMGIGGASRNKNVATPSCPSGSRCVETPLVDKGFSSYFALEVGNDPNTPEFLWEFTHPKLGFSTTGAAIVKTNAGSDNPNLGGNWYTVFASGPTGPIDTTENQFKADSDQNLHLFVLNLATGAPVAIIDTGISRAFGGAISYASVDVDRWKFGGTSWYSDDVLYMGFNRFDAGANKWKGGIIRIIPGSWNWSIVADDADFSNFGPITSAVTRMQDSINHNLWLFVGTGRYNYKLKDGTVDDPINQQYLFGIKESATCYTGDDAFNPSCNGRGTVAWSAPMNAQTSDLFAERCITTPIAAPNGNVYFISFAPTKEVCKKGGTSTLRVMQYSTGNLVAMTTSKVMVMLGGGIIADVSNSGVIGAGGGGPPSVYGGQGIFPPVGMKKILHIKER